MSLTTQSGEKPVTLYQGLSLVYGFNRYEGLRSFKKTAELDPRDPMAYWGMAFALAPYVNMDDDPSYDIKAMRDLATRYPDDLDAQTVQGADIQLKVGEL